MKKLFTVILISSLLATLSIACFAENSYSIDFSGDRVVPAGSQIRVVIGVNDITVENGINGLELDLKYDSSVLTFVSAEGSMSDWTMDSTDKDGVITFNAMEKEDGASAVNKDDVLYYTVTFKVSSSPSSFSTDLIVDYQQMTQAISYNAVSNNDKPSYTIKIRQTLSVPANPTWDETTAKWDSVENADSYVVQLYKDGKEFGDEVSSKTNSVNLDDKMIEGGKYTFTVRALSDKEEFGESDESAKSTEYNKIGALVAPTIELESDTENGGLKYQITDKNADGTVAHYVISVISDGSVVDEVTTAAKAGNIKTSEKIKAGSSYSVSVSAKTADVNINLDSVLSKPSAEAKAADKAESISFDTLPSLSYVSGDKLDLSAVTAKVKYESGDEITVKYSDFSKYGITCNFENKTVMAETDSGKCFILSVGLCNTSSPAITVSSSECKHKSTRVENVSATCGEDGYENTVCNDCGAVIKTKIISATGEHTYGEWEVTVNPTTVLKGQEERKCSVCGHVQTRDVPAITQDNPTTDDPSETTTAKDNETTADETTASGKNDDEEEKHPMSDISKIFLTIIIIIFLLIVILMIAVICLENKKAKARKRRKKKTVKR